MPLDTALVCDGYPDCPSGEDEQNCPNLKPETSTSTILVLNEDNFDRTVLSYPKIMVEFYTTSCIVCINFVPEYERAANEVRLLGLDITFAKVNLDMNVGLKLRFDINTYPRLILWDNSKGYSSAKRYFKKFGLSSRELTNWIRTQVRLPSMAPGCNLKEHTCDYGGCVTELDVCDGYQQCRDGTDETYCSQADGPFIFPVTTTPKPFVIVTTLPTTTRKPIEVVTTTMRTTTTTEPFEILSTEATLTTTTTEIGSFIYLNRLGKLPFYGQLLL